MHRNDLGGNAFLLIRHTGMRMGECADLSSDCLRSTGPDQWAVRVRSANSKPNASFQWIRSWSPSSNAYASFAPSIRCLSMAGSWPVPAPGKLSFDNSAITCTRSVIPWASPRASSPTNEALAFSWTATRVELRAVGSTVGRYKRVRPETDFPLRRVMGHLRS
jgi:hypothetical protein